MARIALEDLNTMELELLFAIDFQLTVSLDEYAAHTQALHFFAGRYHPHDPPPVPPVPVPEAMRCASPASSSRRPACRSLRKSRTVVVPSPPMHRKASLGGLWHTRDTER